MSGLKNKPQQQAEACQYCCSDLLKMMTSQMQLMTKLIEQNNELITQAESREQYLLEIVEQNNELLSAADTLDDDNDSGYLDS